MKDSKAKDIAKDVLQEALSTAYYKLENTAIYGNLTDLDIVKINIQINKLATRMLKTIGREYYTV